MPKRALAFYICIHTHIHTMEYYKTFKFVLDEYLFNDKMFMMGYIKQKKKNITQYYRILLKTRKTNTKMFIEMLFDYRNYRVLFYLCRKGQQLGISFIVQKK